MPTFFLAPYEPTGDTSQWEYLRTASDLKIDPTIYKRNMQKRWPRTEFFESGVLAWNIYEEVENGTVAPGGIGRMQGNQQIVTIDTPNIDFFLWHRSVISSDYRIWLFDDTSWDSFELKTDTTPEDIDHFFRSRRS